MPLISFPTIDDVPEALRSYATQAVSYKGYTINVVPSIRLDEFREVNDALTKRNQQLETAQHKLLEEVSDLEIEVEGMRSRLTERDENIVKNDAELKALKDALSDGEYIKAQKVQDEIFRRTEAMRKTYDDRLTEVGSAAAILSNFITDFVDMDALRNSIDVVSEVVDRFGD